MNCETITNIRLIARQLCSANAGEIISERFCQENKQKL